MGPVGTGTTHYRPVTTAAAARGASMGKLGVHNNAKGGGGGRRAATHRGPWLQPARGRWSRVYGRRYSGAHGASHTCPPRARERVRNAPWALGDAACKLAALGTHHQYVCAGGSPAVSPRGAGAPMAPVHIASSTIARTMRILATVGFEAAVSRKVDAVKRLIYHSKFARGFVYV
jgi:hypothetical protein